jgi:UbiD family decarboxylase
MSEDLREFLQEIEAHKPGEFIRVKREIARDYEMAALVSKLETDHQIPVLLFEKIKDANFPVVVNCFASRSRIAFSLGVRPEELVQRYQEGVESQISPVEVASAPVQEVVLEGNEVDLTRLPLMRYHDTDAAPYLTAGIVLAKDPDTGEYNLSFNRMMLKGQDRFGVFMTVGKHLHEIYSRMEEQGKPLPIVISLGNHPAWAIGTLFIGPYQVNELGVIGGLMKRPMEMDTPARRDLSGHSRRRPPRASRSPDCSDGGQPHAGHSGGGAIHAGSSTRRALRPGGVHQETLPRPT